ncbi:MAG: class I SAM-dependent methyltransferase [Caldilineae bacterium]|nr:MAG: class I SAM-dependent methyltransferase [Caldilineae bacterium]
MLQTFMNEARATLMLVEDMIRPEASCLEVGAGLCLFSLYLKRQGIRIKALEPAIGGYGAFAAIRTALLDHFSGPRLTILECPAQELRRERHGEFDVIFSNNVLEHIPEWPLALQAMIGVLAPNGIMRHACPNYSIPYEPHYGVPVFRHWPGLSRRLFLPASADPEIWDSLNFICHRDIRRFCAAHGLSCRFEKGLLYRAMARLLKDPVFQSRHQGAVTRLARLLHRSGLLGLLKNVPPALATPMIFDISRSREA